MGALPQALEALNEALRLAREKGARLVEPNTLLTLGEVYAAMGEQQRSIESLNLVMKNVSVIIFLLISSLCAFSQSDSVDVSPKPYDIKSCKITYRFKNGIQQGEKTIVFDDYGKEEISCESLWLKL